MRVLLFVSLLCGLVAASACGPSTGPTPHPTGDGGTRADAGASHDGGLPEDGGHDGGSQSDGGMNDGGADDGGLNDGGAGCTFDDPLDDFGVDSNCDGAEGVVASSIYVSNAGDDIYGGTPEFPVKTLARAAALHALDHSRQYVLIAASAEPYSAEGLGSLLTEGAVVTGALFREHGWTRPKGLDTARKVTTVISDQRGVQAEISALESTLSWVSLQSVQTTGVDARDTFGLVLSGTAPLRLAHVAIEAGDAADGAPGERGLDAPDAGTLLQGGANQDVPNQPFMVGAQGGEGGGVGAGNLCGSLAPLAGGRGGNRGTMNNNPAPQPGAPGVAVPPALAAAGGAAGEADIFTHAPGPGADGEDGAPGAKGAPALAVAATAWQFDATLTTIAATEDPHAVDGALGGGGGGGGGAEIDNILFVGNGGGGAGGGAGGCPGGAGGNGGLGGFSVGIVATGKWPTFLDVAVITGEGGNGGAAGAGGLGGAGGAGGVATGSAPGGNGGAGGNGGEGGDGAPGNGGWSIGVLAVEPLVTPDELGEVTFTLGGPGAAGAPATDSVSGASGQAVATQDK